MRIAQAIQYKRTAPPMTPLPGRRIEDFEGRWVVLHTKSRNEKALAWDLQRLVLDYFLPLARVHRSHGGRRVEVQVPLFSGYVFLSCRDADDRQTVLLTNRVAKVIEVEDQVRLKHELGQIYQALNTNRPINLYPRIERGSRCRVTAGSLKGVEGVVMRRGRTSRILLAVGLLGQSASLVIDAELLEPIERREIA